MSDTPTNPSPPAPPKRRRRFRWYARLALVFVGLIIVTVVLAQVLFWTDLPRSIVQKEIGNILHVDARLGSLRIGWLGHVRVRGLTLQLPTETEPFLKVDEANLKLAPLPMLAFDQEVRDLDAAGVALDVRQLPDSHWNLEQLIATAKGPSPTPSEPTDPAKILKSLPSVRLERAHVTITKNDGKRLDLPDVGATLDRTAPLTTAFAAHVGPELTVEGRVATLGSAPHQATLTLTRPPPGLAEFLGVAVRNASHAKLEWAGRLTRAGLVGTLTVDDVAAGLDAAPAMLRVAGRTDVNANADGSLLIRPVGLTLRADPDAPATQPTQPTTTATTQSVEPISVAFEAGQIRVDDRVRLERLRGTVNGAGKFALDGLLDPTSYDGELSAAWESVAYARLNTTGHLDVRAQKQFTGKLRVDAGAGASVRVPSGEASGTLVIDGEGAALDAIEANLTIEPLTWTPTGKPSVVGPALVGVVAARGDAIDLESLRTADPALGSLVARAHASKSAATWWATLDASQLKLPPLETMGVKGPIDANVAAYGDASVYVVQHLYGRLGPASAWATGAYRRDEPKPLRLDTWAWLDRPRAGGDAQMSGLTAQGVVGGTLGGVDGARDIEAALDVRAAELVLRGRRVGDVAVRIDADVTDDRVQVASREMELLGGAFALNAYRDLNADDAPYLATLDFKNIPVARLGDLANQKGLGGTIDDGHVDITVPASLHLDDASVVATARATNLAAQSLRAESLTVSAALKDGVIKAVPILREGDGTLDAELTADARLARPIALSFDLVNWPAPAAAATTQAAAQAETSAEPAATRPIVRSRASAKGDVAVTLRPDGKIDATLTMNAGVDRDGQRLAELGIDAAANDTLLTLKKAIVNTLDGTLHATGSVDVTNVGGARLDASFERLAPSTLGWIDPLLSEVRGRFDGSLTVAPATSPRPLGPIEIALAVRPTPDAGFRSVSLGAIDARGYAAFDSPQKYRIVTDRAEVHVAGGVVRPFGRFSYDASVGPSQLVTVKFDRLDIDQLTRVAIDDGKPITGRLGGTLRVYGSARTLDTVSGEAAVKITESDLANFGPVAALYNVMNIGAAGKEPTGTGDVSARVESGTLTLLDATYFNRGVFANAFGSVKDVAKINDAALDLYLVGSAQPLKSSGNSFLSQIFGTASDTLAAFQGSLTTVRATGTLKHPKVAQVALSELGSGLKSVLVGKTKE